MIPFTLWWSPTCPFGAGASCASTGISSGRSWLMEGGDAKRRVMKPSISDGRPLAALGPSEFVGLWLLSRDRVLQKERPVGELDRGTDECTGGDAERVRCIRTRRAKERKDECGCDEVATRSAFDDCIEASRPLDPPEASSDSDVVSVDRESKSSSTGLSGGSTPGGWSNTSALGFLKSDGARCKIPNITIRTSARRRTS